MKTSLITLASALIMLVSLNGAKPEVKLGPLWMCATYIGNPAERCNVSIEIIIAKDKKEAVSEYAKFLKSKGYKPAPNPPAVYIPISYENASNFIRYGSSRQ